MSQMTSETKFYFSKVYNSENIKGEIILGKQVRIFVQILFINIKLLFRCMIKTVQNNDI